MFRTKCGGIKKISNFLGNINLYRKLLIVWGSTAIIIITCFGWFFYKISENYNREIYKAMVVAEDIVIENVEEIMYGYEYISDMIFRQSVVQDALANIKDSGKIYSSEKEQLRQQVNLVMQNYHHIDYILFQLSEKDIEIGTFGSDYLNAETEALIEEKLKESNGNPVWIVECSPEPRLLLVRHIKRIENLGSDILATLIMGVDVNALLTVSDTADYDMTCMILDNNGNIMNNQRNFTVKQLEETYLEMGSKDYGIVDIEGNSYFFSSKKDENRGWIYFTCFSFEEMKQEIYSVFRWLAFIGCVCLLFVVMFNTLISRDLNWSFHSLIEKFNDFSKDLSVDKKEDDIYTLRKDEVGILYRHFCVMKEKIHNLVHDNYVLQLEKKSAQIEMLELQISPHFLYNTLQTISWQAKLLRNKQMSEMIEALSRILQLTLSNKNSFITLEEELEICEQFVVIELIRQNKKINYEVNVDFSLMDHLIPKLCIQPLVENSIHYSEGMNEEGCFISVDVVRQEGSLLIYVKNSGSLFMEDLMCKLREKIVVSKGHGIGILNIDNRIKLMYGSEYGVEVYNEDERAVVLLTIPYSPK